ncbi:hypothetical protein SDJN03_22234, partial [Cucurbita argyrosperma subsp. sororia]
MRWAPHLFLSGADNTLPPKSTVISFSTTFSPPSSGSSPASSHGAFYQSPFLRRYYKTKSMLNCAAFKDSMSF